MTGRHSNQLNYQTRTKFCKAVWTGLEPATPCVTGRYSNQLNYHTKKFDLFPKGKNASLYLYPKALQIYVCFANYKCIKKRKSEKIYPQYRNMLIYRKLNYSKSFSRLKKSEMDAPVNPHFAEIWMLTKMIAFTVFKNKNRILLV